jgi:ComF family protein
MSETEAPWWTRWGSMLLDLLFPPRCVGCRRAGEWLCRECLGQVGRVESPICARCGRPFRGTGPCPACRDGRFALGQARSPYFFEGALQHAVYGLKYRGRRVLAGPLGRLLTDYLRGLDWPAAAIVPVPLNRQRERARGYNQSALLARALAAQAGWPLLEHGLVRWRNTRPQVGLAGAARQENVRGAFRWEAPSPPPAQVLLLDDVYTTGATMEACAAALREAGAGEVRGLALARPR